MTRPGGITLNKKRILSVICIGVLLSLAACNLGSKKSNDFTQNQNEFINKSNMLETSTNKHSEIVIDEDFGKVLLRRLVVDDIPIKEGNEEYFFSEQYSPEYMEKIKDSNYYILDINGDGVLDIGIKFPTNVLATYYYNLEGDFLTPLIGLHMYTEILGEGQYMTISSSASQTTYFYEIMINGNRIVTISFGKEVVGTSALADGTEEYVIEYTVNSVQVTQQQWELLSEPLWKLRENAPHTYTYESVMNVSTSTGIQ